MATRSRRRSKRRSPKRCTSSAELLREDFVEELEDFAFAEAIREGQQTGRIERDEIFGLLEDQA